MFNSKQTQLFSVPSKSSTGSVSQGRNSFVEAAKFKSAETRSGNGALKYDTTLDTLVDQFGRVGSYRKPRSFAEIEKDSELLWAEDKLNAVKFFHYLRTVSCKTQLLDGTKTEEPQKGAELKHESIMRMIWLSQKSPETFWKNIGLFVSLGSWHDIFTMLQTDLIFNGWEKRKLDWKKFGDLILTALNNSTTVDLVKKYLPQIKAKSACRSVESQANCLVAKWICSLLFGSKESSYNYKLYRKLKSSGTAHDWQQLISKRKFTEIDFSKIHGRALAKLVKGKFLDNQGLKDKYAGWVAAPTTELKYTGFVHELFEKLPSRLSSVEQHTQDTINKQFNALIEKAKSEAKDNSCKFIVARDISSSMNSTAVGLNSSSFNVAKALALYFSEFLTGPFADSYMCFASKVEMRQWKGSTPLEKWFNDDTLPFGGTNFQGTIDLFVKLKGQGISEDDFPTGIICISDGDFNATHTGKTNVDEAKSKLRNAGFSKEFVEKFTIVLWNIPNGFYCRPEAQFETKANDTGAYYFSGFSGSVISFITGHEVLTARQLVDKALDQEVLNRVQL